MKQQEDVTRRQFLQMAGSTAIALRLAGSVQASAQEASAHGSALSPLAKRTYDASSLSWQLIGMTPDLWSFDKYTDITKAPDAEIGPIPATIPGSVQGALLHAGLLPDWNVGLNSRQVEWVENRDWVYQAALPDAWLRDGKQFIVHCAGLDYSGKILLNGNVVCSFDSTFVPCSADLQTFLKPTGNLLQVYFQPPPRWLGQFGYTSRMTAWKPRFNYGWDWTSRMVQTGVWDKITLEVTHDAAIKKVQCVADAVPATGRGTLRMQTASDGGTSLRVTLTTDKHRTVREETVSAEGGSHEIAWDDLPVELWWPSGMGKQALYGLRVDLLDEEKRVLDTRTMRVGFRHMEWKRTAGAPADAHPYLCVVNGKELFLFGINWTPIRTNFADLKEEEYSKRIALYQNIGVNIFRVWGGGFPERDWLYDLADEHGILIWQELPLSSSGMDNYPPADEASIASMAEIAASYVRLRQHHACLAVWCGGNELEDNSVGHASADPTLTIGNHPMIERVRDVLQKQDPQRGFLPTSPYGPVGSFTLATCGQGKHWDVHGPWNLDGPVDGAWRTLWEHDDAMFHSEMGAPSTSSADLIRRYSGDLAVTPGLHSNTLWNRQPWWLDWPKFVAEKGREPASLEEFVAWNQKRQADALVLAVSEAKSRFPACGGIILWMGHDGFPCTSNTSIVDFEANPKPAALALRSLMRGGSSA